MFTYKMIKLFYSNIYFLFFALNNLWPKDLGQSPIQSAQFLTACG